MTQGRTAHRDDLRLDLELVLPDLLGHEVADAIETILDTYLKLRQPGEEFLSAYRRVGAKPFKEALYATA